VLRSLRSDGTVPRLPVVVFSASDTARKEALRLGAAGFVLKGGAEDELIDLVKQRAGTASPAPI
jgi:DNA-binding NarL/FixJ family response regulator